MPLDLKSFAVGKANGGGGEPGEIVTEKLSVKANGTYVAPSGKAYTPVSVNVPIPPEPTGTTTITTNGTHDVKDFATAEVNVPERELNLQNKTATENGTYSADEGYDGIGEITVAVEGGQGEGYTVSSIDNGDGTQTLSIEDGFFPTETLPITTNGEYDVAKYGKVEVDVKSGGDFVGFKWEEVDESGYPTVVDATSINPVSANMFYSAFSSGGAEVSGSMPYKYLTTIKLPNGMTRLPEQMCYNCGLLSELIVDTSMMETLGPYCLGNCSYIKKLDITSQTFRYIDNNALYNSGIEKFIIRRTDGVVTLGGLRGINTAPITKGTGRVYVPDDLVEAYKSAPNWLSLDESIIVPLSTLEE